MHILTKQYQLETAALVFNVYDRVQHSIGLNWERTFKPSGEYNSEVNPVGILIIMETLQLLIQGLIELLWNSSGLRKNKTEMSQFVKELFNSDTIWNHAHRMNDVELSWVFACRLLESPPHVQHIK